METTEKKPSRKRVAVGQPFWTMARNENGELEPKQLHLPNLEQVVDAEYRS
jgi:hypothetical protein